MLSTLFGVQSVGVEDASNAVVIDNTPVRQLAANQQLIAVPPKQRGVCGFVGLDNLGATCYLNSLIQVLYHTPEFRDGLNRVDPLELGLEAVLLEEQSVEKEAVTSARPEEVKEEVNESLLESMCAMGFDEPRARLSLLRAKNDMETAFDIVESITSAEVDAFVAKCKRDERMNEQAKPKVRRIPLELQRLFARLQLLDRQSTSTHQLTAKGFHWDNNDERVQHDAHELNRLLIDAVEKSLRQTPAAQLCRSLYAGQLVNRVRCSHCGHISSRAEECLDWTLQAAHCSDFAASLWNLCAHESLTGSTAYFCEQCSCKRDAMRATHIDKWPALLTICSARFRIDRETNWQRVKITSECVFPLVFRKDRVACHLNSLDLKSTSSNNASSKLSGIDGKEKDAWLSSTRRDLLFIGHLRNQALAFVEALCIRDKQCESPLSDESVALFRKELCWVDGARVSETQGLYQLQSIVVHEGTAHSGHYVTVSLAESPDHSNSHTGSEFEAHLRDVLFGKGNPTSKSQSSSKDVKESNAQSSIVATEGHQSEHFSTLPADSSDEFAILNAVVKAFVSLNKRGNREKSGTRDSSLLVGVGKLCQLLNWDSTHRKSCGSLAGFLSRYDSVFVEVEKGKYALLQCAEVDRILSPKSGIAQSRAMGSVTHRPDDGWEPVDGKKKKKQTVTHEQTPVVASSVANATVGLSTDTDRAENTQRVVLRKNLLAEQLLRSVFGSYYLFNDMNISPMSFAAIESLFSGTRCAYLLLYRDLSLSNTQGLLASSVAAHHKPVDPNPLLAQEVEVENHILKRDRDVYAEAMKVVQVFVLLSDDCDHEYAFPFFRCSSDVRLSKTIPIECTLNWQAKAIKARVLEARHTLISAHMDDWQLALLSQFGSQGLYPRKLLNDEQTLSETSVSPGDVFVMWSRNSIPNVLCGESSTPVACDVVQYLLNSFPHKYRNLMDNSAFNPIQRVPNRVYLCRDFSLLFNSQSLCNQLGLSLPDCILQCAAPILLDERQLLDSEHSAGLEAVMAEAKSTNKEWFTLFDGESLVCKWLSTGAKLSLESPWRDLWIVSLISVEKATERGLHTLSLRERFDVFEHNAMELTVSANSSLASKLSVATLGPVSERVNSLATVSSLKVEYLWRLCNGNDPLFASLLSKVSLRVETKQSEFIVIRDETITIKKLTSSLSLAKAHIEIALLNVDQNGDEDLTSKSAEDTIDIVGRVRGGGDALDDARVRLTVSQSMSVRGLRDLLGVQLLSLPSSWVEHDSDSQSLQQFIADNGRTTAIVGSVGNWRLRSSDWKGFPNELLCEQRSVEDMNDMLLVRDLQLVEGDVMWIEPGRVPLPNSCFLKVFFWKWDLETSDACSGHRELLPELTELQVQQSSTLDDIYGLVSLELSRQLGREVLKSSIELRELQNDKLPGKSISIACVSMKSAGLSNNSRVVVQPLESRAAGWNSSLSFRLWLWILSNPQNPGKGSALMSPEWPPMEIAVLGGVSPSLGHLQAAIRVQVPEIPVEYLVIFKRARGSHQWKLIHCPAPSNVTKSAGASKKKPVSLNGAPHNLREGDCLCVFDARTVTPALWQALSGCEAGASSIPAIGWDICTAEDQETLSAREELKRRKEQQAQQQRRERQQTCQSNTDSRSNGKKAHGKRVEKSLVIKMEEFED